MVKPVTTRRDKLKAIDCKIKMSLFSSILKSNKTKDTPTAYSVGSTGVSLSARFESIPSHNPFRASGGALKVINGSASTFADLAGGAGANIFAFRNPRRGNILGEGESNVNRLAVLRASKDAEILRLRAQVRSLKMRLLALTSRNYLRDGGTPRSALSQRRPLKYRVNRINKHNRGMVFGFGRLGKQRLMINKKSNHFSGNLDYNGTSPLNRKAREISFNEEPTKEDLDHELEEYMSQCKSKKKVDLDKELDEYMTTARSQSFAGKIGLVPNPKAAEAAITTDVDATMQDD